MYPFELPYVVRIFSATHPCGETTKEVFTFRHLPYIQPEDVDMQDEVRRDGQGDNTSMKKFDRI
jgi:hypothetical protein